MSEKETKKTVPTVGEWSNKPTLTLNPGEFRPFTFGLAKAKLIIEHLDAIREFVASDGKSCGTRKEEDEEG